MTGAVVDTAVLSNFARVRRAQLLQQAFPDIATPHAVVEELEQGERLGYVPATDWSWLKIVILDASEEALAGKLAEKLGLGESACLAVASTRALTVLTDDQDARRMAKTLGLNVSGTLGVLARLVSSKAIDLADADSLLGTMIQQGYRSPVRSLRELGVR